MIIKLLFISIVIVFLFLLSIKKEYYGYYIAENKLKNLSSSYLVIYKNKKSSQVELRLEIKERINFLHKKGFEKIKYDIKGDSIFLSEWIHLNKAEGESWYSKSNYADLVQVTLERKFDTIIDNIKLNNCAVYKINQLLPYLKYNSKYLYFCIDKKILIGKKYYYKDQLNSTVYLDSLYTKNIFYKHTLKNYDKSGQ